MVDPVPDAADGELPELEHLLDPDWLPEPKRARMASRTAIAGGLEAQIWQDGRSAREEKIRLLNLKATALKGSDIESAILCLRYAQQLAIEAGTVGFDVRWWLRLPAFLAIAGRSEDAERELDSLESDIARKEPTRLLVPTRQARSAYKRELEQARRIARQRSAGARR